MYNKKLFLIYLHKVAQYTDSTKHHCHIKEALISYINFPGSTISHAWPSSYKFKKLMWVHQHNRPQSQILEDFSELSNLNFSTQLSNIIGNTIPNFYP
jgi:hypothetical protein